VHKYRARVGRRGRFAGSWSPRHVAVPGRTCVRGLAVVRVEQRRVVLGHRRVTRSRLAGASARRSRGESRPGVSVTLVVGGNVNPMQPLGILMDVPMIACDRGVAMSRETERVDVDLNLRTHGRGRLAAQWVMYSTSLRSCRRRRGGPSRKATRTLVRL
jgi:hypothetical protein